MSLNERISVENFYNSVEILNKRLCFVDLAQAQLKTQAIDYSQVKYNLIHYINIYNIR
jgi:hypothetical protein